MIGNYVSKLEDRQEQFKNFGGLIAKILLRDKEEAEVILKLLNQYLSHNPDLKVLDVRKLKMGPGLEKEWNYVISTAFKCCFCHSEVEEEVNIKCTYAPSRSENNEPICETCEDGAREVAEDYPDYGDSDTNELAGDKYEEEERIKKEMFKDGDLRINKEEFETNL